MGYPPEAFRRFTDPIAHPNAGTYKDKRAPAPAPPEGDTVAGFRIRLHRRRWGIVVIVCVIIAQAVFWMARAMRGYPRRDWTLSLVDDDFGSRKHGHTEDTFAGYKHRGTECDISSMDLHRPFGSVCPDKDSVLEAMSGGGRIGKDAPYVPRRCDMRWYDTREACEILNRYSQVVLIGDSMLRHITGALNVLLREDLGYGGVTDWNFNDAERHQCFCYNQFDVQSCSVQGIYSTKDVPDDGAFGLHCPKLVDNWQMELRMELIVRYPIPDDEMARLKETVRLQANRPQAFVLGHGLWNNLDQHQSAAWLDTVTRPIRLALREDQQRRGARDDGQRQLPMLLVTPNAAGDKKPDEWLVSQGNKALVGFERAMAIEAARRRIDHLGTWNMSIQATLYDGVHMDLRGNLVKAMMVLNWLDYLSSQ